MGHAAGSASFRDPRGRVLLVGGRVLRLLTAQGKLEFEAFRDTGLITEFVNEGALIPARALDAREQAALGAQHGLEARFAAAALVLEHEAVPFPSYPFEWPAEMLAEAGLLTIRLTRRSVAAGFGTKDATPYNVLFRGPEPVFVDFLSFEPREPRDPTWLAYAQFNRTFVLPLMAHRYFGLGLDQIFLSRRDGLEPEDVYRMCAPLRRLRPPFLNRVTLPQWLGARHRQDDDTIYRQKTVRDAAQARFVLDLLLGGQERSLRALTPKARRDSHWSGYMETHSYAEEQFRAKEAFVTAALAEARPARVLDVGCNTGHFSAVAARQGASVVAIDYDAVVAGNVWRLARRERLDILPLCVNLARPSPAVGWRNGECRSFLERAAGHFDFVLMLAVVHHMLVSEGVPLAEILSLAAGLSTRHLLVEYVGPGDRMFRRLLRGRAELHRDLTPESFENTCQEHWRIVRAETIAGTERRLYLLARACGQG